MRLYTNNTAVGFYPVGTAAIVWAESATQAAELLELELKRMGLDQKIQSQDMILFKRELGEVRILRDGNY